MFTAIPKKAGALECDLQRTISIISHVTRLLLRIMQRVRKDIQPEIGEGKGATYAVYLVRKQNTN